MILISLEFWDPVNEVWMRFCTKWVYKSNDLMHDICLYLKNIINLCTDSTAKAHRDRGRCAATGKSREQRNRNGAAVRAAGNSWKEAWGHTLHSKCPRAAASISMSWWAQAEGACPSPLELCRQGTATATCPFRVGWALGISKKYKNDRVSGYPWTEEGDIDMEIRLPRKAPGWRLLVHLIN